MGKWLQVMVTKVMAWWRWWVGRADVKSKVEQNNKHKSKSNGDVLCRWGVRGS